MTVTYRRSQADLPHWKFREGGSFRLHGRKWIVTATNREGRVTEVIADDGNTCVEFVAASEWRDWAAGHWRYPE